MQKYKNVIITLISTVIIAFLIIILIFLFKNYVFNSKEIANNNSEEVLNSKSPKDFSILGVEESSTTDESINNNTNTNNANNNTSEGIIQNNSNNSVSSINTNQNSNNSNQNNFTTGSNNASGTNNSTNNSNKATTNTSKNNTSAKSNVKTNRNTKLPFDTSIKSAPNGESYSEIAYLDISKLKINYPVLSTSSTELLKISITKFWGSDPNEVGNCCIIGHNYHTSKFFGNLQKIRVGDTFKLTDKNGRTYTYKVYDTFYVKPSNTDCTSQLTNGRIEATLITCSNDGKRRFVVKAAKIN